MEKASFITTSIKKIINWSYKSQLVHYPFATSCCTQEYLAAMGPQYDLSRFGSELPTCSPTQADLLLVTGSISHKMAPVLKKTYENMPGPKWVIACGSCAISGGIYQNYSTVAGIDKIIPVDKYIAGCPPRPEMIIDGIIELQKEIMKGNSV